MGYDEQEDRPNMQDQAVINREGRRLDRLKEKTKAFRRNMKETLSAELSGNDQKAAIARDMLEAKNHPDRIRAMKDQIWGGVGEDVTGFGDIPDALKYRGDDDDELV